MSRRIVSFVLFLVILISFHQFENNASAVDAPDMTIISVTKDGVTNATPDTVEVTVGGITLSNTYIFTVESEKEFSLINSSGYNFSKAKYKYYSGYTITSAWTKNLDLVTEIDSGSFLKQATISESELKELGYTAIQEGCNKYYYVVILGNVNFAVLVQVNSFKSFYVTKEGVTDYTPIESNITVQGTEITNTYILTATAFDEFSLINSSGYNFSKAKYKYYSGYTITSAWTKNLDLVTEIDSGSFLKQATISESELKELGYTAIREGCSKYYYVVVIGNSNFAIIIQCKYPSNKLDTTILEAAIAEVPTSGYYTENDRYNGKITSSTGFWADMQTKLSAARSVLNNASSTQTEVENAAEALTSAIKNLISDQELNATLLYETIEAENNRILEKSNYTSLSWDAYLDAKNEAEIFLESLFDETGAATSVNVASDPSPADAKAEALTAAFNSLYLQSTYELTQQEIPELRKELGYLFRMIDKDNLKSSDYSNGWEAFETAYNAALARYNEDSTYTGASSERNDLEYFRTAFSDLYNAWLLLEESGSIQVTVTVNDNFGVEFQGNELTDPATASFQGSKTLETGKHTLKDLCDLFDWSGNNTGPTLQTSAGFTGNITATYLIYINGIAVRDPALNRLPDALNQSPGIAVQNYMGFAQPEHDNIQLHDGDEVVILRVYEPMKHYYGVLENTPITSVIKDMKLLRFTTDPASLAPKEGDSIELNLVSRDAYWSTYALYDQGAAGKEIVYYGPMNDDGTYPMRPTRTGCYTDANGNATIILTKAGNYVLTAVDTSGMDCSNYLYPGLAGGAHLCITVTAATSAELEEARETYLLKLDELLAASNINDYSEEYWQSLNSIITTGKTAIETADSMDAILSAYQKAVEEHGNIAVIDHAGIMARFAGYLKYLPSITQIEAGFFTKADQERMGWLLGLYDTLTDYQKEMISPEQSAQYAALTDEYGTSGSGLPDFGVFTVSLVVDDLQLIHTSDPSQIRIVSFDQEGNQFDYSPRNGAYGFVGTTVPSEITTYTITAGYDTRHKADAIMLEAHIQKQQMDCFDEIEVEGAEIDSITVEDVPMIVGNVDKGYYRYTYYILNPYHSFTVHIKTVTDPLQVVKNSALTELENALNGYKKSDYTAENWNTLTKAYSDGVAAINAAASEAAVDEAKLTALDAMAAVKKKDETGTLGSVTVIVENTTYDGADFTGTIIDTTVNLTSESSMMKCVLTALAASEPVYSWTGTGGNGYGITYLSSIYIDANGNGKPDDGEKSLAEFDGGPQSGWMGTLNDWFVNEGFNMFTVANGKLKDGDVIRVQYTVEGYGTDLGATWANNDTSLKALTVDGGSFGPEFKSNVLEYVLTPVGSSASLMPTAANKNFQVRIFLNEQNKTADAEYYRSGESIPVKSGDVIWIGVGEKAWGTMNDGSIVATWYKIYVVSEDDANAVVKLINAIGSVTYSNYETKQNAVDLARAAYDALTSAAKSSVMNLNALQTAETAIAGYLKVDALKAAIAALPRNITEADREAVEAAKEIYDDLAENAANLLNLLSVAETNKLLEAVNTLTEQPKSDDAGVKSIKVNGVKATGSGTNYAVTLPIGSDVAAATLEIETADKATVTEGPTASNGGTTWSFTVTAEDGVSSETYTVTLTVSQMEVNVLECAIYSVTDDVTVVDLSPVVVTGLREAVKVEELGLPETAQSVSLWLKVTAMSKNGSNITVKLEPMFAVDGGEEQQVPADALIGSFTVTLPISCTANARVLYGTTCVNATGSDSGITFTAPGIGSYTIIPDAQIQGDTPAIGNGSTEGTTENGVTTFAAGTAADAPTVSVTAPEGGWTMDGTTANSFTVSCENDVACVVLVKSADGSYTRLIAENAGTTHTFHTALNSGDELVVVVKGDISGDGKLSGSEVTQIKAAQLKSLTFTEFENLVADLDGNGKLSGSEVTQIKAAQLRLLTLAW